MAYKTRILGLGNAIFENVSKTLAN